MIVAKIIFLCKQARPKILTGVEFLTTLVREPDKDDDNKLGRILIYLSRTMDLVFTLESDGTRTVKWWLGAAFSATT